MNLLLIDSSDYIDEDIVQIGGRRHQHMVTICQIQLGSIIKVGRMNGKIGTGEVIRLGAEHMTVRIRLSDPPPAPLLIDLIVALPRPKVLGRLIETVTSLGVKNLFFVNSYHVEKSFWQSDRLFEAALDRHIRLGLEQAKDTLYPNIQFKRLFKPFVEDELPFLLRGSQGFVAHPLPERTPLPPSNEKRVIAVGPENGFTQYEVDKLAETGMALLGLGPRVLKVEVAVTCLVEYCQSSRI